VAGEADYLVRVMVADLPTLAEFTMKRLMRARCGERAVEYRADGLKREGPLPLSHLR
jgi:hypothetical protein